MPPGIWAAGDRSHDLGLSFGSFPSTGTEISLVVDSDGAPHALFEIGFGNNDYTLLGNQERWLVDLTLSEGRWVLRRIDLLVGVATDLGDGGAVVIQGNTPQTSRLPDGTKVFFGWTDNRDYQAGDPNDEPNLMLRGYDVGVGAAHLCPGT